MNQKVMQISYRVPSELNNGDIAQCPLCRKKFVVVPGLIQYRIDGGADVVCPSCALATPISYYEANPIELPKRTRTRGNKEGQS